MDTIEGIDAVTYSTDRWDEAHRFLGDWGLKLIAADSTQQVWETLNGAQVIVRRPDDASLPKAIEAGPTMREVTWGVLSAKRLDELADILKESCGFQDLRNSSGQIKVLDPHGLGLVFQISVKRQLDIQGASTNPYGNTQRVDLPSPVYERATPVDIGHVVLFTDQLAVAEVFYTKIGFVTSDRYPGRGIFMRCSVKGGHHDIFLLQLPNKAAGLNHVAFTVRDIHEVFGGGLHMSRCGWKTQLGPGRHPISSAYFWYFENPCGALIEYNADEDKLTEKWVVRDFEPGPTVFAEWAIDGGLDGTTRRQPHATVSGAFLSEKR